MFIYSFRVHIRSPAVETKDVTENNNIIRQDTVLSRDYESVDTNGNVAASARAISIVGTLDYMAPEMLIFFGKRTLHLDGYNSAIDFWSLGVCIYKLLTGREPLKRYPFDVLKSVLPAHLTKFTGYREAFDALFGTVDYDICGGILTEEARSVIRGFLEFFPDYRLGYNADSIRAGHNALMDHPFFSNINWDLLESKQFPPPYIPTNEILKIMTVDHSTSESLCGLLRKANKGCWCEEFEPHPNDTDGSHLDAEESNFNCSNRIRATDQYYFRMWNYINPSLLSAGKCK